ncbi:MAG: gluconate 2-dehydrogenase subunit 3 family protein [Acidobacteria bacterium]|nr:gluconate 2-dehydrogenase subunit 3 family protein [Acidobacteriota bacterium]
MKAPRREALRIVGAISSTCAFPFAANELYAQHAGPHGESPAPPPARTQPEFFTAEEFALVSRMADLIIPATSTPGALAAGVPMYIDMVVSRNQEAQRLFRTSIAAFDLSCRARRGKPFLELDEAAQIEVLTPLCEAADAEAPSAQGRAGRKPEVALFKAVKSMTADGYYTSKAGLIDELGYSGNTVMAEFPVCTHEH